MQATINKNIAKHQLMYTNINNKQTKQYGIFVTKPSRELSN